MVARRQRSRTTSSSIVTRPGAGAASLAIATVPATGGTGTVLTVTARRGRSGRSPSTPRGAPDGESIFYDFYAYDGSGNELPGDLWSVDVGGTRPASVPRSGLDEAQPFVQGRRRPRSSAAHRPRFRPVTPVAILDTREGVGAPTAKVQAKSPLVVTVRGLTTDAVRSPADATASSSTSRHQRHVADRSTRPRATRRRCPARAPSTQCGVRRCQPRDRGPSARTAASRC